MDGTTSKFGLRDCVGYRLIKAARTFERQMEEDLKPFGLTRIGWNILLAVNEENKRNPSDIAEYIGVDRTATSRALRDLEAGGLIERRIGRTDRRTTDVLLTELGRTQIMAALPRCLETVARFDRMLGREQSEALKNLLDSLIAAEEAEAKQQRRDMPS